MMWQGKSVNFMSDFDDFVDLSILVPSTAINNIKKGWITIDFDELWGGFGLLKVSELFCRLQIVKRKWRC